ncbi:hypothetical protein FA13DRAFT_1645677 [Coprinellus micaceus]|uniref:DUF6593 domain-containing protein n=1 Tax=Coprinellus micaceus TaxID=71717 RepID=A0A4Y7SDV3_COPMI|nr:hypothetical protein FA13DRAFT_1645677 [Coprinellus micaceus]
MQLILTTRDPYNASYCTPEGQVIYRVVSPFQLLHRRRATIDKVVPTDLSSYTEDMQDQFERIGEVEYHTIFSSIITFGGVAQSVDKFFRKKISLLNLASHRIFTGPDGKEYRWKLGYAKPVLYLNDDTSTPVAKFHQQDIISITPRARRAALEIFPAGEHMVDLIVVTLVYIEKLRRNREGAAKSGRRGGGGPGGDGGGGGGD